MILKGGGVPKPSTTESHTNRENLEKMDFFKGMIMMILQASLKQHLLHFQVQLPTQVCNVRYLYFLVMFTGETN